MSVQGDVNRLKKDLEKQGGDPLGCPQCIPIRTFNVREGPGGETVQLDGSPLPPMCGCDHGNIKIIEVVIPDGFDATPTKEETSK